jgi:hypothetical protein
MGKLSGFGLLVAVMGSALLIGGNVGKGQTGGALQYPPAAVGEDAQPPPPARMAPQSMSPRRIELGGSGSSEPPGNSVNGVRPRAHIDGRTPLAAPLLGPSPTSPPSAAGD